MSVENLYRIFPGLNRAYGLFYITERKGPKLDGYGKTIREEYKKDKDLEIEKLTGELEKFKKTIG